MKPNRRGNDTPLYEQIAAEMGRLIDEGTYRPGDRLPSVRECSRSMRVSINTVLGAYAQLENRRMVESRPQSGYYVASRLPEPREVLETRNAARELVATTVELGRGPLEVMHHLANPSLVPLGRGVPNSALLPAAKLNRMLAVESRRFGRDAVSYASTKGMRRLRTQIAQRSFEWGCRLGPDEIVVTSGCVEAVTLALQATCSPGHTVAVSSPCYYTFLNSIQWLGLKILEIPSTPRHGMSIDVLRYALRQHRIGACIVISNFDNPLGSVMPDERKRELVELLGKRDVALIEDDVYGDLAFGRGRPVLAKAYDERGLVLTCSSFSKTLAPGYRIGWIIPGRFQQKVERMKSLFNVATASPTQLAVAEFLTSGGYDRHLRSVRRVYAEQVARMRDAVGRHFPRGTQVTRPEGGFVLWVEMPEGVDSMRLYQDALRCGIAIAPGALFSTTDRFRSCIRLNAAFWSTEVERAIETVGAMACGQTMGTGGSGSRCGGS
jgi:DNA-binding transcriptional MocR family regulator